jgi:hypothetical protein
MDPGSVWSRFKVGPEATIKFYRDVYERLKAIGFEAPILDELRTAVEALEEHL